MKKVLLIKIIILTIPIFLLAACAPQPQSSAPTPQATALPDQTALTENLPTPITIGGFEPITAKNAIFLDQIHELGEGEIFNVAISPDNRYIAVLSPNGIHLFDRATYEELYFYQIHIADYLNDIQFSQNGESIFFSNIFKIYQWDFKNNNLQEILTSQMPEGVIRKFSFSPNEDRIIITTVFFDAECENEGHNTALYDLDGNLLFDRYTCDSESYTKYKFIDDVKVIFAINSFYLNNRSDEIAFLDSNTGVILASAMRWENKNGEVQTRYSGSSDLFPDFENFEDWLIDYFPDTWQDTDKSDCQIINQYNNHYLYILYKDEQTTDYLIDSYNNKLILKTDISTCDLLQKIHFPSNIVYTFSPDDAFLATSDDFGIYLWELQSGKLLNEDIHSGSNDLYFSFNNDGSKFISINQEPGKNLSSYQMNIWDTNQAKITFQTPLPIDYPLEIIKTNNPERIIIQDFNTRYLWNLQNAELIRTITGDAFCLDPKQDAFWVSIQVDEHTQAPTLFDTNSGEELLSLPVLNGIIEEISFSSDGTIVNIRNKNESNVVHSMWLDLNADNPNWEIYQAEESARVLPFRDPSVDWKISSYFAITNYQIDHRFSGMRDTSAYFSNSLLLNAHNNVVDIWDTANQEYLLNLQFDSRVNDVAFSPGGNYIAVFLKDGIVKIFGVKTNQ